MPTDRETMLAALFALLPVPADGDKQRNPTANERPPIGVRAALFDGKGEEIDAVLGLGAPLYIFEHRAELELAVQHADEAQRRTLTDAYIQSLETAIAADRTLGGLVDDMRLLPPDPADQIPVDDDKKSRGMPFRFMSLPILVEYTTASSSG